MKLFSHVIVALTAFAAVSSAAAIPESEPEFEQETFNSSLTGRDVSFAWGKSKLRGVSLGGWLVMEPFIKPSLFDAVKGHGVVDEWTYSKYLGKTEAKKRLLNHWKTFITRQDFVNIKANGFNAVRIPIGYWAFGLASGDPYVQGQDVYLDAGIYWARVTGLKVIIDLHGVPGSQNGFDHSGHKGALLWTTGDANLGLTRAVYNKIAQKYAKMQDVVIAIQVVNEPFGPSPSLDMAKTKQYLWDAYGMTRAVSNTPIILHDAFFGIGYWFGFMTNQNKVIMDAHLYQIFTHAQLSRTAQQHVSDAYGSAGYLNQGRDKWTIVGEWSGAMTDCAPHLNGYGAGARYEGKFDGTQYHGPCSRWRVFSQWSSGMKGYVKNYIKAQRQTYEANGDGWIFWTWKTEGGQGEWDAQVLLRNGLFW